jgi:hypothetical protein
MGCESTKLKPQNTLNKQGTFKRQGTNRNEALSKGKTIYVKQKAEILTTGDNDQCRQSVELFLSLLNVKDNETKYKIIVFINNNPRSTGSYNKILETNLISGDNIYFENTAVTDYFFEKEQKLRIQVFDEFDNMTENQEVTMARIMGSSKNIYTINTDYYDIQVEARNASGFDIIINFSIKLSGGNQYSKYNNIYFLISNFNDEKTFRKVYKSEEIDSINGSFDKVTLDGKSVNNGKNDRKLMFEVFDYEKGSIGFCEASISELMVNSFVKLKEPEGAKLTNCSLYIVVEEIKNYKFVDLLKMGLKINLYIGIDYTSSNGDPALKTSLHYINGLEPNPYERAIRNCGNIVGYYDDDQKFPTFGFGGIPKGQQTVNFCFNVSFSSDYEIQGIDNVVKSYRDSLNMVRLYGPTNFAPLIRTVNECVKRELSNNLWSYAILMIITDGLINDMDKTIDEIVEASYLPISLIIIGVGSADFFNMNILDADDNPLKSSNGKIQERDNVQFVEYTKYEGNYDKLAEEVLEEIPLQIQQYYQKHKEAINKYLIESQVTNKGNSGGNIYGNFDNVVTTNSYNQFGVGVIPSTNNQVKDPSIPVNINVISHREISKSNNTLSNVNPQIIPSNQFYTSRNLIVDLNKKMDDTPGGGYN